MKTTDVLIIGSGIAGASAALKLAQNPNRHIMLLTLRTPTRTIEQPLRPVWHHRAGVNDSADLLVEDILAAGAVPRCAGARILADGRTKTAAGGAGQHAGSSSTPRQRDPDWGQEGAHSRRRILHVG